MAEIKFYTNDESIGVGSFDSPPNEIGHLSGSGLGFFGGSFGISVPVNSYQSSTFTVNENGTEYGIQGYNNKYNTDPAVSNSGMVINESAIVGNSGSPNYQSTLNVRFTNDEYVRVQNCRLRIFDRSDINQHAQGVTTQVYECRHPSPVQGVLTNNRQLHQRGVTDEHAWVEFMDDGGTPADMLLTSSPGQSGMNTDANPANPPEFDDGGYRNWEFQDGSNHQAKRHDWYIALSASPDSIGSKTDYGLYFTLEYL